MHAHASGRSRLGSCASTQKALPVTRAIIKTNLYVCNSQSTVRADIHPADGTPGVGEVNDEEDCENDGSISRLGRDTAHWPQSVAVDRRSNDEGPVGANGKQYCSLRTPMHGEPRANKRTTCKTNSKEALEDHLMAVCDKGSRHVPSWPVSRWSRARRSNRSWPRACQDSAHASKTDTTHRECHMFSLSQK